jgi:hypothetical protein
LAEVKFEMDGCKQNCPEPEGISPTEFTASAICLELESPNLSSSGTARNFYFTGFAVILLNYALIWIVDCLC